jgi:hypothetical protein
MVSINKQGKKYGEGSKKEQPENPDVLHEERKPAQEIEEPFTPFNELCRFADKYDYKILIDKPFAEFDELLLEIRDKEDERVERVTLKDITEINKKSARLLNKLSKKAK